LYRSLAPNSDCRPQVSIVIVAYNSGPLLTECVRSALASTLPVKVIVSDNGSDDCSLAGPDQLAATDSRLVVVRNGRNLGFAAGNNRVLEHAEGSSYVLFLNPDCIMAPDTLERMLAQLALHPDAGMAGCVIRNPDGSEQAGCRRRLPTPRRLLAKACGLTRWLPDQAGCDDFVQSATPLPTEVSAVEAISGAFMLVRSEALKRVGSFDEAYFMHWEDLDLCARFRAAGDGILFVPDVEVLHFKGRSSARRPLRVEWYKHTGMARYLRKFHHSHWPGPLFALATLPIWLRFLAKAVTSKMSRPLSTEVAVDAKKADVEEVWVFGATSPVGGCLLPRLLAAGHRVRAFSRNPEKHSVAGGPSLIWHAMDIAADQIPGCGGRPAVVIHLAPLYLLPGHLDRLLAAGMERLIAFGSTSVFTKRNGTAGEVKLAEQLAGAEREIEVKCGAAKKSWAIFRPTIVYGAPRRGGIAFLSRFARRFGFIPVIGSANGLRQPVHVDDLARACLSLLDSGPGWNRAYDLGGGETLSYREMLVRIFRKLDRPVRILRIPEKTFMLLLLFVRWLPAYRGLNIEMARRMERDMCFASTEAHEAFGYQPRPFDP
jgi:GT2 family glycosyltransferase/nucleoside-diphosphate-sugar epimerase